MRIVDLRSDTITHPTPAMRRAMAEAEVGDDVFGEDPTINKLEKLAAERLGKEAALYVPTGTMGNMVSVLSHCGRGDEVILGDQAHIMLYEQGGIAALGGVVPRTLPNRPDGTIRITDIEAAIRPDDVHHPRTRLIALENTHNRCNGSPLTPAYMRHVRDIADEHGIKIHVDGARIFNSAVAQSLEASELAADADSITFCLSKALAAPAGSVVCGRSDFIAQARRARKVLGGGMRQAGILAAAGIVALNEMVDRLAEDHLNARRLAEGLSNMDGLSIAVELVRSNIVFIGIAREEITAQNLCEKLKAEGVRMLPLGPRQLRAVTNYHVTSDDIAYALGAFRKVLG
ncbi:MAG: low-specificity L-threonine aldolase [Syntrophobacteraceae bacterium]